MEHGESDTVKLEAGVKVGAGEVRAPVEEEREVFPEIRVVQVKLLDVGQDTAVNIGNIAGVLSGTLATNTKQLVGREDVDDLTAAKGCVGEGREPVELSSMRVEESTGEGSFAGRGSDR